MSHLEEIIGMVYLHWDFFGKMIYIQKLKLVLQL